VHQLLVARRLLLLLLRPLLRALLRRVPAAVAPALLLLGWLPLCAVTALLLLLLLSRVLCAALPGTRCRLDTHAPQDLHTHTTHGHSSTSAACVNGLCRRADSSPHLWGGQLLQPPLLLGAAACARRVHH
jgi:hypothetical protein